MSGAMSMPIIAARLPSKIRRISEYVNIGNAVNERIPPSCGMFRLKINMMTSMAIGQVYSITLSSRKRFVTSM